MSEWIAKSIGSAIKGIAAIYPDNEYLVDRETRVTYKELEVQIQRFSKGLLEIGIKPGDHLALWMQNSVDWVVSAFSIASIGAVFIPVNTRFKSDELEYILKQSNSSTLILADKYEKADFLKIFLRICPELQDCTPGALKSKNLPDLKNIVCTSSEKIPGTYSFDAISNMGQDRELQPRQDGVDPHKTACILYTSGSTAFPKGVMLSHNNILRDGFEIGERLGLNSEDKYFNPCPYYHCAGLVDGLLAALTHGSCNVSLPFFRLKNLFH